MAHPTKQPPAPEVEIREMELEDIAPVFILGERLFTSDRWPSLYRTWDEYEVINLFASDGDTCFVAALEERVVGFALGAIIEKRRNPWKYGYLIWIGVDEGAPVRGIGQRLLKVLTQRFIERGARMMLVDTDAENDRAINFFKKSGFGNVQHHIYMTKNLTHDPDYLKRKSRRDKEREHQAHEREASRERRDKPRE